MENIEDFTNVAQNLKIDIIEAIIPENLTVAGL